MRVLTRLAAVCAVMATAMATAVPAGQASAVAAGQALAVAAPSGGGCHVVLEFVDGHWESITVCSNGSGNPGGPGSGGGSGGSGGGNSTSSCTLNALPAGYPDPYPAPKGQKWMWEICTDYINGVLIPGTAGLALVGQNATTAAPGVTPEQLFAEAEKALQIPQLTASTAPPRGKDGLVGLPEWFWVPAAQFHAVHSTVSVGPVFATVTASPGGITFSPGSGLPDVSCHGPGTPYNPKLPASAQSTDCSYTYGQPSVSQPGNAYQASISVTWNVSWVGSGGAGGNVGTVPDVFPFAVPVAQGEALVTNP